MGELIQYNGKDYTIVGVVKDMVTQSPYMPVEPTIFFTGGSMNTIIMRIKPDMPVSEVLAKVELIFKKYNPHAPFDFSFVDEVYARKFSDEERIGNLAAVFAILAIFISFLGLFGLASFVAEQRTKEIGIRKVLGASVANLWKMLSKDFVVLVIISSIIAMPLSSYFINNWLMQYAYRTTLSWHVFAIAGLSAVIVTLLTASYQAIKAAIANPVKSLRSE